MFENKYGQGTYLPISTIQPDKVRLADYIHLLTMERNIGKNEKAHRKNVGFWMSQLYKGIYDNTLQSQSQIHIALEQMEKESVFETHK